MSFARDVTAGIIRIQAVQAANVVGIVLAGVIGVSIITLGVWHAVRPERTLGWQDAPQVLPSWELAANPWPDELIRQALVTRTVDGDTFDATVELLYSTRQDGRFRFLGFDAPELRGAERERGLAARDRLADLLHDGPIWIRGGIARDSFGRWLVDVRLLDGRDPVEILRAEGHAK